VQSYYELLEHTASECIGFHTCEAHSPFGGHIAERMKKTAELFGN
jgi:predicted aldo/keto reductase-like oxidoreductase